MSPDPFDRDLTETQQCIVDAAERNPDMSANQIADHCDCSAGYVRETINDHGDPLGIDIDLDF